MVSTTISVAPAPPKRWHFSVEDVLRMVEAGILDEDERVELIEGELLAMSPIGKRHVWVVMVLEDLLRAALGSSVFISVQNPLQLSSESAPQPDLVVLRRRPEGYRDRLPAAADALLVIEVADTSLDYDRGEKLAAYAGASVVEVWVVNLIDDRIEQYADPSPEGYRSQQHFVPGQMIQARHLPLALEVDAILR